MTDITEIVVLAVSLAVALATAFVFPQLRARLSAEQLAQLKLWVRIAVQAAEMLYVGTGRGAEKKEHVQKFLHERGLTVDMDEIDALIESAVYELKKT